MAEMKHLICLLLVLHSGFSAVDWSECDKTKYCDQNNDFKAAYRLEGDKVLVELWAKKDDENDKYVAVGFSEDTGMGNEPVLACFEEDGKPVVLNSFNPGKSNAPAPETSVPTAKLLEFVSDESQIYCKFEQPISQGSTTQYIPDLSKPVFLLLAKGPVNGKQLNYHSNRDTLPNQHILTKRTPDQAETPAEQPKTEGNSSEVASAAGDAGEKKEEEKKEPAQEPELKRADQVGSGPFSLTASTKHVILRYHGVAMLFGWFGFLFTGVFAARFLRHLWPNTTVSGLRIWFHIHRILNFLGVLLIVFGSVLALISKDLTWTGPSVNQGSAENLHPGALHSIIGAIGVLLALAQPFGALARCSLDHPKRPVFNFFHRSFGLLAVLLAVAASIIAVFYFKSLWKDTFYAIVVLLVFLLVGVAVCVIQEMVKYRDEHEQQRIVAIEMRNRSKQAAPSDSYYFRERQAHSDRHKKVTVFLFLVFALAGFIAATILTYLILDA
ncbi:unnamed protein product [Bursaphelenchus okinawaensis]|uniref:Cytochrome b561 domain-containing protein n=1 Tax=Bursaphelenchus okinawaensis TaxID=465554 RepID=A0A811JQZ6_9BILA|nr:unnamed protein product [Bursaphelenchus okinawaensis]CAG9078804.1 unnamed protein product [Bursaphelenchus okinawaensis]